MASFFLRRPAFAWVIAILTMVAGLIALTRIPIAQYPAVAPPTVIVYADYPGASARTVEDAVTAVLEQQMHGIPGLLYLDASSEGGATAGYCAMGIRVRAIRPATMVRMAITHANAGRRRKKDAMALLD